MRPILLLDQVSYQVADKKILTDISLSVKQGEFLTISGPSGGGKSTLLKIIASMVSPTTGDIFFKGKPLEEYNVTDYRKQVSYSFQNATLFGETVQENMAFPVGVGYRTMHTKYTDRRQQVLERLALGATAKQASTSIIRESIVAAMGPTVDRTKTVGLVSLPGMMSGLMFAGINPVEAIRYQIVVMFMLIAVTGFSTMISSYLSYKSYFNDHLQLVV